MSAEEAAASRTIAALMTAVQSGDVNAPAALFDSLYNELRRVASRQLMRIGSGSTLGATTLLHECYLGLADRQIEFPDRASFLAYAARAMRGLVVDYIRRGCAYKRGGEFHLTSLDTQVADEASNAQPEAMRLNDALVELQDIDASLAELVDLKFFCGFSFADIATMRDVSERTVQRDWKKARLVLHGVLKSD